MPLSLSPSLSLNSIQTTLETPPPPPTTTSGHHEPSLLAVEPPHREEHFNQSEILIIHLRDSVENNPSNPFFHSFYEVILTSKPFS
ncbi:hypothetical protein HKD37_02G004722 [Glycine soja]